jgi:histidine ammonia-lyase
LEEAHAIVRTKIARRLTDREFSRDIDAARMIIRSGEVASLVGPLLE